MKRLIIARNAKQSVPDEFLDKVLPLYATSSGMSFLASPNNMVKSNYTGAATKEDIQAFLKEHNDSPALIVLGDGADSSPDDHQPFVIIDDGGNPAKPILVAAIEGEFNSHAKAGSTHSPEFFVAKTALVPLIAPAYEAYNKSIGKVMEELGVQMVANGLKNLPSGRGSVVVMANTGRLMAFAKEGKAYQWGWVSDTHGFLDGVHEIKEPVKAPSAARFGSVVASVASAVGLGTPAAEPAIPAKATSTIPDDDDIPVVVPGKPSEPQTPEAPKPGDEMVTFDFNKEKTRYNNQELKRAYRLYLGNPDMNKLKGEAGDWKNGTWPITVKRSMVRPEHVRFIPVAALQSALIPLAQTGPIKDFKDIPKPQVDPVDPNAKPVEPAKTPVLPLDDTPVVDAREKNNLLHLIASPMFSKLVAAHGELIKDPVKWAEAESKWPSFTEGMGMSVDDVMKMPFEAIQTMARGFPKSAALLVIEFRLLYAKAIAKANALAAKHADPRVADIAGTAPKPQPMGTSEDDIEVVKVA